MKPDAAHGRRSAVGSLIVILTFVLGLALAAGVAPAHAAGYTLSLTVSPTSGMPETAFIFSGTLLNATGRPVADAPISLWYFLIGDTPANATGTTNSIGVFQISVSDLYVIGTYAAAADYNSSGTVLATSPTVSFAVSVSTATTTTAASSTNSSLPLTLTASSSCVKLGVPVTLTAFVGGAPSGTSVSFQYAVNSSSYAVLASSATNSLGRASITFTAQYNGTYMFRAVANSLVSASIVVATSDNCQSTTVTSMTTTFTSTFTSTITSVSNTVLTTMTTTGTTTGTTVVTSSSSSGCGFLGFGCVFGSIVGAITGTVIGIVGTIAGSVAGTVVGIISWVSRFLNPFSWLNSMGLGWVVNAFLYMVDAFLIFINIVIATLPYLGFIILMINLFYVVQFDFEGLFNFWSTAYQIVAMIANAIFSFVQIIVDIIQAITGGVPGGAVVAAGA